ncbi:Wadjet anti-phage system protein JetD domain-containing protein [Paenibacillus odorifer]|uniref:Wadjet anti-phage system protein JetD domain-containing protein n=1 Tax=Paenibacillus TaxID=44249 RepID=UPI00096C281C|nr:Wadjet anti-phage system protein JetD domain-containing protein [Paenibacillus odorifer]OMC95356.1 hypothetical protein BJP46_07255 [Paenibacillus odorifer]
MRAMILIEKIIGKYEKSAQDWKGESVGNRSLRIQQKDYDEVGKSRLLQEAGELEAQGLLRVKWFNNKTDIEKIIFSLEDIPNLYQMLGKTSKAESLKQTSEFVNKQMKGAKKHWIRACYEEILRQLENGIIPKNLLLVSETGHENSKEIVVGEADFNLFCICLNALDVLQEPIYKRIFSKYHLGNSKTFEKILQSRIISQARKYHPDVDDNMSESEVLSQLYIEEYSQELAVKGELILEVSGERIDLSKFIYGTVLNSEMLKYAQIATQQKIRKIITVENKANYISMKYEPGTLIIFSHGYFSPKERDFLKELGRMLGKEVAYFHTGDLDYGGVKIFQYIRIHIFPQLHPFLMDVAQYETYETMGEKMDDSTWLKISKLKEPMLQPLIDMIVKKKIVIEQESFLYQ